MRPEVFRRHNDIILFYKEEEKMLSRSIYPFNSKDLLYSLKSQEPTLHMVTRSNTEWFKEF